MTTFSENHPDEEALIAFALGENGKEAAVHIEGCARCRAFVQEMRDLRASVEGLDDDEPPRHLAGNVIRSARSLGVVSFVRGVFGAPGMLMFIMNLATVMLLVFVYLMVTLLL